MSKTWYGHHIETIKGTDYILFKDYLELDKEIDRLNKNQKLTPEERNHLHLELDEIVESLQLENERLNNILYELEKDIEQQITFCTNEADATTNDKYCRIAINYLKHLKDKIKELRGEYKE